MKYVRERSRMSRGRMRAQYAQTRGPCLSVSFQYTGVCFAAQEQLPLSAFSRAWMPTVAPRAMWGVIVHVLLVYRTLGAYLYSIVFSSCSFCCTRGILIWATGIRFVIFLDVALSIVGKAFHRQRRALHMCSGARFTHIAFCAGARALSFFVYVCGGLVCFLSLLLL